MKLRTLGWFALGTGLLAVVGCPAGWTDVCDNGACDGADGGGGDSPADVTVDAPFGCDPSKDPKDSPLCVANTFGIFVSPTGSDGQPGTREQPVATPTKGLELAKKQNLPRVYVCEGTYGALSIGAAQTGLSLYGGFDCTTWVAGTKATSLVSTDNTPALKVDTATTTLVDLGLKNGNATVAGDSSIAALAIGGKLTLRRVSVEAGEGKAATQPVTAADLAANAANDGKPGTSGNNGGKTDNACANGSGTSTGAVGGGPTPGGTDGAKGQPFATYPVNPALADGKGGSAASGSCGAGSTGMNGSYGPGGPGGSGAAKAAVLDASGFKPSAGGDGTIGKVGQGGGGGASLDNSGGGGGGGAGGCGGAGGTGGAGGGASIALALVNTPATLQSVTLTAHNAGDGAQGGTGQKAQQGGLQGNIASGTACSGGKGGHGGGGGGGGGGAGGLSVGIAWTGTAPTLDGTATPTAATLPNVTLGTAGKAGAAGSGGPAFIPASNPGQNGTAGVAGVAQAVLEVK